MSYPQIKKISIAFAALLLLALPGCGKPGVTGAAPSSAGTAQASPSEGAPADSLQEPVTLTVERFDLPVDATGSELFTAEGGKYYDAKWVELARKFNVTIKYQPVDFSSRDDAVRQMLAAGGVPGAILTTLPPSECRDALAKGLIRALPQNFEKSYANIGANLGAVRRRDEFKTGGGAYCAVPRALEGAEPYADTTPGFYYRKDLAARSGLEAKSAYTLDELYAMFERIHNDNPGIAVFGSVTPSRLLALGLAEIAPETTRGEGFYKDAQTGKFRYAYQSQAIPDGIRTLKKFYDAGFLDGDFNMRPLYEARARFTDGTLFAYADALDIPTADAAMKDFGIAQSAANPGDAVGFAWILDDKGSLVASEGGNSWSEWIFGDAMDDRALARFLTIYDYLLSADGLPLAIPGKLGSVTPLVAGALEDTRVCALNPAYSDEAKQMVSTLRDMRKSATNLAVLPFDPAMDGLTAEQYQKATSLAPADEICKIVREKTATNVGKAWQNWLAGSQDAINALLNELNSSMK